MRIVGRRARRVRRTFSQAVARETLVLERRAQTAEYVTRWLVLTLERTQPTAAESHDGRWLPVAAAGPVEISASDADPDLFIRDLAVVRVSQPWRAVFVGRSNRRRRNPCR